MASLQKCKRSCQTGTRYVSKCLWSMDNKSLWSNITKEELVSSAMNHVDTWFIVDILFSSYKMLIVFTQSKRCNQNSQFLPRHTVDVARKSLRMFQSLMSSELSAYWGIRYVLLKYLITPCWPQPSSYSLILMHQFIPFFILCGEIIGSHRYNELEDDFILVSWLNDFVDKAAEERPELRPIAAIAKAMTIACQQVQFPASWFCSVANMHMTKLELKAGLDCPWFRPKVTPHCSFVKTTVDHRSRSVCCG